MRHYHIAVLPGDGIGSEVIPAGVRVLEVLAETCGEFRVDLETFGWGSEWYLRHGAMMPPDGLQVLERAGFDAVAVREESEPYVKGEIEVVSLTISGTKPGSGCRCCGQ